MAEGLKAARPDVPQHTTQAPALQEYRQWVFDCRVVANAIDLYGPDELKFLSECGCQK